MACRGGGNLRLGLIVMLELKEENQPTKLSLLRKGYLLF